MTDAEPLKRTGVVAVPTIAAPLPLVCAPMVAALTVIGALPNWLDSRIRVCTLV